MKQLISDIKEKNFQKAYLLFGKEDYLIRFYARRLVDITVAEEDRFMNLDIFNGDDVTLDKLETSFNTYPLMGEKRVTWIKDSGWFSSKKMSQDDSKRLISLLSNLMETSMVIFMESDVDKRLTIYKEFSMIGYAAELNTPDEGDLIRFVAKMLQPYGKQISAQTAAYFIQSVGGDMIHLQVEIGKAAAHAGDSPIVTPQDIDAVCTRQMETKVFKMTDAIGLRNRAQAMKIYEQLLMENNTPRSIFFPLVAHIRRLYRVKMALAENMKEADIPVFAEVSPKALWSYKNQCRIFQRGHLEELINTLVDLDEKVKTSLLDEKDLILSFISHC